MAGEIAVRAVILSIGSELMRGDIVDTNAAFLSRELSTLGFEVRRVGAYPDVLDELTRAVSDALCSADVTVCTGGLGPTQDDLTREAIASAVGEELYFDEALFGEIEQRFALLRRNMPASNRRQASLIPSAEAISNANGTAPGWFVTHNGTMVVAMPGPPKEMQPMWGEQVVPRLQRLLPGHLSMVSLMTFGLGESAVEERIAEVIASRPEVTVATYAKDAGVQVHISARAGTPDAAEALVHQAETRVRHLLGNAVYGNAEDTLSSVVGRSLRDRRATLAVMESASGGDLASLITNNPGSSEYFLGGVVAYTRDTKSAFGVDAEVMDRHGLVSPETALSMAAAARTRLGAAVGLGVTGIAGGDAVEGHPPGTCFVALDLPGRQEVREVHRPASREVAKRFFAQSALDLLRRHTSSIESTRT
jgi:nicotinamide-nucleotide amidase